MKQEKIDLFYGSLLHDIGKVIQRSTDERRKHAIIGADWVKKYTDNLAISQQIRYHMSNYQSNQLEDDNLSYITYIADNIASGVDRRENVEEIQEDSSSKIWDTYTNLEDIFNVFATEKSKRFFAPRELNLQDEPNFANEIHLKFSKGNYAEIQARIEKEMEVLNFDEAGMDSLLNLFEATLSFVPSSTNTKEIADISLAEHSKLVTAFAMAIYDYLESTERKNYKKELYQNASSFYKEKAFLLVSFDISGIQEFIYNIATSGAAKQLKARSLYLDFMGEHIADSLLKEMGLSRANLMYVGGGHAYLILANTSENKTVLSEFENEYNEFLLEHFKTKIYIALGWTEFAAADVMSELNSPLKYRQIYQSVSRQISLKKISRYDANQLKSLNNNKRTEAKECHICHSTEQVKPLHDHDLCIICTELHRFANQVSSEHFVIDSHPSGLPIGPNAYLRSLSLDNLDEANAGKVYVKNKYKAGAIKATHVFIGDYTFAHIHEYAGLSQSDGQGIKRVAVVRLDVDNLGAAFMAGFTHQGNGRYNTLSRSAMFSRSMSLFFKVYINQFAQDLKLSIIYAGGDDVFAIGKWQDIIRFTVLLRQSFVKWTNNKLTLSAGVGLFPDKTPISLMARYSGELEDSAKANGKDSISIFSSEYTFKFNDFINNVYNEKLEQIRHYFNQQDERGKVFIYKLIELLRSKDEMGIARLAYYLSRLEDLSDSSLKESFREFKQVFLNWYSSNGNVRKEAELALILYIYETRKER